MSEDNLDYMDTTRDDLFHEDVAGNLEDQLDENKREDASQEVVEVDYTLPEGYERNSLKAVMCQRDSTMDVTVSHDGTMLCSLLSDGFTFLISGSRGSVGISSGVCVYEVRIIEETPGRRCLTRLGFGTSNTSLILGDGEESIGFESDGSLWAQRKRHFRASGKFSKGDTLSLILNLIDNTISLFCNGKRSSRPEPLPEALRNKALFPLISFNGSTLLVNQGRSFNCQLRYPLAFTVPMLQEVPAANASISPCAALDSQSKRDVLFPIGLPGDGLYDWVDNVHNTNPGKYTEISERAVYDWIRRSGFLTPTKKSVDSSLDRPDLQLQIHSIDDGSVRKVCRSLAAFLDRDIIIAGVKDSLMDDERHALMEMFPPAKFNRHAVVLVGSNIVTCENNDWPDVSSRVVSLNFNKFSLPSADDAWFDQVTFLAGSETAAHAVFADWVEKRKLVEKISDLKPDLEWVKSKNQEWLDAKLDWRKKHRMFLDQRKAVGVNAMTDGPVYDVWSVEDVNGGADTAGVPLYAQFQIEDWTLINIRYELHLLLHVFKNDTGRLGIHKSLIEHYYSLYYGRSLYCPQYGAKDVDSLLSLVADTVKLNPSSSCIEPALDLSISMGTFVRLTEEARRTRELRISSGDESARLKLTAPPQAAPPKRPADEGDDASKRARYRR